MATQALYRRWRSQTFEEVIGQQHVTQTLQNALTTDRVGHAYLFTGPRGTGKTSTARILAKAVNCTGGGQKPCNQCDTCQAVTEGRLMDLIEIDAASNTSVDDIRDLRDKVGFRPNQAEFKFYIIDEVHMLSKSAFNALLKTLEEPPAHVLFVLATTEPERIPATILSRCQRFDFRRISVAEVAGRLRYIVDQEGLTAEDTALTFIARQGGGSMRDAISLLDQLTAYGQEMITLDLVQSVLGAANTQATQAMLGHVLTGNVPGALSAVNEMVSNGVEPRQFTLEILEYVRGLLLTKYGQPEQVLNYPQEILDTMTTQAQQVSARRLYQITERFNQAVQDMKLSGDAVIPQLPLELAVVDLTATEAISQPLMATDKQPAYTSPPQPATTYQAPAPVQPTPSSTPQPAPSPAPAAPPTSASPPASSAALQPINLKDGLNKEKLRAYWAHLVSIFKSQGSSYHRYLTRPNVADVEIQGDTIVVYFAPEYHKARDRAEKHKTAILDTFHQVLGKQWLLEFRMQPGHQAKQAKPTQAAPPPPQPPAPPVDENQVLTDFVKNKMGGKPLNTNT